MNKTETIELNSLDFENLPEEISEEVRSALAVFSEAQENARKKRNEAYQTELADTLVSIDSDWIELFDIDDVNVNELKLMGWVGIEEPPEWWKPVADRDGLVHMEPSDVATIHQFYNDLYGWHMTLREGEKAPGVGLLVNHRHRMQPYEVYTSYPSFIDAVSKEEASFIYAGEFWQPKNNFYRAILCQLNNIGAFVVDLDRVEDGKGNYFEAGWVMETLLDYFEKYPEIKPNYLCLSGTGIHLWYVFGQRIPLYRSKEKVLKDGTVKHASPRRERYAKVSQALVKWFAENLPSNRFKVDTKCYNINHAYRAPGSPSKDGFLTRMFVCGGQNRKMVDPLGLSDFLGCPLRPYEIGKWDPELYQSYRKDHPEQFGEAAATERQLETLHDLEDQGYINADEVKCNITSGQAGKLIREGMEKREIDHPKQKLKFHVGENIEWMKPRDEKLYQYTLNRIPVDTPVGSREQALFALAGIGFLCLLTKEEVQADMDNLLYTDWAKRLSTDGKPLERRDIRAAMRGYNVRNATMDKEAREDYLGWQYNPPAKRNHKKQSEHLEYARGVKNLRASLGENVLGGPPVKQKEVLEWRVGHPTGNKSQCARETGLSRTTVIKWWDAKIENEEANK